jgi:hypothetical protein
LPGTNSLAYFAPFIIDKGKEFYNPKTWWNMMEWSSRIHIALPAMESESIKPPACNQDKKV